MWSLTVSGGAVPVTRTKEGFRVVKIRTIKGAPATVRDPHYSGLCLCQAISPALYRAPDCITMFLFVSLPMGLNLLCYLSHLLERCHSACGHKITSHLCPVLAYDFIAMQAQHSYTSSAVG